MKCCKLLEHTRFRHCSIEDENRRQPSIPDWLNVMFSLLDPRTSGTAIQLRIALASRWSTAHNLRSIAPLGGTARIYHRRKKHLDAMTVSKPDIAVKWYVRTSGIAACGAHILQKPAALPGRH